MAIERSSTPYGEAAYTALRAALSRLQAGDPLAPVTVLVHSNAVGVAARRWLAANGGVAAAQFLTTFRLGELLGGPALAAAGRRPMSTPIIDVAVREVLARRAGLFAPIAHHQATITALRDAHRELRHLPDQAAERIAAQGSRRAREVVRVHRDVQHLLAGEWYDEADLLRVAAGAVHAATQRTVVFLPQRTRPTEAALVAALGECGEVVVVEGIHPDQGPPPAPTIDTVDASDADEEVREALRVVAAAVHDGTPLHRVAIVWPADLPYARLVSEQLDEALIPWNGRSGTALHERLAPRLVLDALQLDRRGIRRADLFALLAHVPPRGDGGALLPRQWWERISRDAGLAADADWDRRLPDWAAARRADGYERDADAALALQAFVADLRSRLGPPTHTDRWQHWARRAHDLLLHWLGGHRALAHLPTVEHEAYQSLQAILDRLARIDDIAPPVTRVTFADTLAAELEGAPGRVGRIGAGVQAGPLSFAVGQTFDLVVVLGACEGLLPGAPPSEAVLTDSDRALAGGGLSLAAERAAQQHSDLWAVLAGARRALLTIPRGDLRATAVRYPSRWVRELVGDQPIPARRIASFAGGVAAAEFPATTAHHRLRTLYHACSGGTALADHPLAQQFTPLQRGVAMCLARASTDITAYDGDLSGLGIEQMLTKPISPTRLEAWVACPHAWFMQYLLGIAVVEQPEERLQIDPRDRGTLVHDVLDRFHRDVLAGTLAAPGASGWGDQHLNALLALFDEEAALLAGRQNVGRAAFWAAERSRQRYELAEWLRCDGKTMVERGAQVVASEYGFGGDPADAPQIALPDGRVLLLKGKVDRIDRCADGSLVVTDHKTGGDSGYRAIKPADPTAGGTRFQLPAYAAAALAVEGAVPGTPVWAEYGFFAKAGFRRIGAQFTVDTWEQVAGQLASVLDRIATGLFVARPQKPQGRLPWVECPYCDPDNLGTAQLWAEHQRKFADPRMALVLPPDAAELGEGGDGDG